MKLEVVLIVPFFERADDGRYFNTAAVIDADGSLLGIYRKLHIPHDPFFYEKSYFEEGDLGYKVFQTRYARLAVLILLRPMVSGSRKGGVPGGRRDSVLSHGNRLLEE
jgi:hypothetical protein